jgi:hypothetical protein
MMKITLAALLLALAAPVFAARTVVVDKDGGDFASVAEASRDAKPGDTVFIRSHSDPLGDGAFAPGVIYATDGKTLESITLKSPKSLTLRGFRLKSLDVEGAQGLSLEKCRVEGGGVLIKRSKDVAVKECAFLKPDSKQAADRVRAEFSQKVSVESSLIVAAHRGIVFLDSEGAIKRNTIVGAKYDGPKLDAADLAEAHDALTSSMGVLIQCNPTMMEAWDKRKAQPAELFENVIASNERGVVVDRCAKGNDTLKVGYNLFHADGDWNYVSVGKKYSGASFAYALEDILAKGRMADAKNQFLDPLFADPGRGDYSLAGESPGVRMAKDKGSVGAPSDVAAAGAKK